MIALEEMTQIQLRYLRDKLSVEAVELDQYIVRIQELLSTELFKKEIFLGEIDGLKESLTNAKSLLTHLQHTDTPQKMINDQKLTVDKIQIELDRTINSSTIKVLTDEEAFLQQFKIDDLKSEKQRREDKVIEIERLLTA
ncbi:hypothetical protein [Reichenbachiella versicolor]|uniref:hypothetical protein n=1 Tax=Reichenbachiella versicolor TaxID=1821036 RepID=UPI000D6DDF50|nr:hypothetical protein [Reichenbachiella versicolor]